MESVETIRVARIATFPLVPSSKYRKNSTQKCSAQAVAGLSSVAKRPLLPPSPANSDPLGYLGLP